jgi:putative tricarboxylic transport membrane protein
MNRERITAIVLVVVSILYILGTYQMPRFEYVRFTPGRYYTYTLGIVLLVLSILLLIKNDIQSRKWEPSRGKMKTIGVLVAILLAMLPIFRYLGIIITFTVGSAAMSRYLGWKRWSTALVVFSLINISIFLLFTKLLGIYLPLGRWPEAILFLIQGEG